MKIKRLIRLCLACLVTAALAAPAFAESEDAPLPGDYQVPSTSQPTHRKVVRSEAPAKPSQPSKIKKLVKNHKVAKAKPGHNKFSHRARVNVKKQAKSAKSRHVLHKSSHGKKHKREKRKH